MRTNFHYLLISSSLSPRITLGRAYTLVLLDFLLFSLPNSVISVFSQLKNSAPGKIKLSKLYFCLEVFLCILVHIMSCGYVFKRGCSLFSDSEISILCSRSDISPVHTCDSLGVRLWEFWKLQVLIGTKRTLCNHNPFPYHLSHYPFLVAITVFSERSHQYLQHKSLHPPSS